MRNTGAVSFTPNHRIATGIHAIGEIGRRIWMKGFSAANAGRNHPSTSPSGTPMSTASPKPQLTRNSEATIYLSSSPCWASSPRPRRTSIGVGKMSLPEYFTAMCHAARASVPVMSGRMMWSARRFISLPQKQGPQRWPDRARRNRPHSPRTSRCPSKCPLPLRAAGFPRSPHAAVSDGNT